LSSGDFEPVFRTLLGDTAPLSPSSVARLKAKWQAVFKVIDRLSPNWRRIGESALSHLELSGGRFADERLVDLGAA
jgi:hypothetical protein